MSDYYSNLQQNADRLNSLITEAQTTALGSTGAGGHPGQPITVRLADGRTVQGIARSSITPGQIYAVQQGGVWNVFSPNAARQSRSDRTIRRRRDERRREVPVGSVAVLYLTYTETALQFWVGGDRANPIMVYETDRLTEEKSLSYTHNYAGTSYQSGNDRSWQLYSTLDAAPSSEPFNNPPQLPRIRFPYIMQFVYKTEASANINATTTITDMTGEAKGFAPAVVARLQLQGYELAELYTPLFAPSYARLPQSEIFELDEAPLDSATAGYPGGNPPFVEVGNTYTVSASNTFTNQFSLDVGNKESGNLAIDLSNSLFFNKTYDVKVVTNLYDAPIRFADQPYDNTLASDNGIRFTYGTTGFPYSFDATIGGFSITQTCSGSVSLSMKWREFKKYRASISQVPGKVYVTIATDLRNTDESDAIYTNPEFSELAILEVSGNTVKVLDQPAADDWRKSLATTEVYYTADSNPCYRSQMNAGNRNFYQGNLFIPDFNPSYPDPYNPGSDTTGSIALRNSDIEATVLSFPTTMDSDSCTIGAESQTLVTIKSLKITDPLQEIAILGYAALIR